MNEGSSTNNAVHNPLYAALASQPTFPTQTPTPTSSARPTTLLPHADMGPLCLDAQQVSTFYPRVPPGLGRVYVLHPLRHLPPDGGFFHIQHPDTKYPELKTGLYCTHCFKMHEQGQSCIEPCGQTCGTCGNIHTPRPFCPLSYNTLTSWSRKGVNVDEHTAPATGSFQPTKSQFAVLQANGYIDTTQSYNPYGVPRFTSKAPLDGRLSIPHPYIFQGPSPPRRVVATGPTNQGSVPKTVQYTFSRQQTSFGGGGYPNKSAYDHTSTGWQNGGMGMQGNGAGWPTGPGLQYNMGNMGPPPPPFMQGNPYPYMNANQPNFGGWYGHQNPYVQPNQFMTAPPLPPPSVYSSPMAPFMPQSNLRPQVPQAPPVSSLSTGQPNIQFIVNNSSDVPKGPAVATAPSATPSVVGSKKWSEPMQTNCFRRSNQRRQPNQQNTGRDKQQGRGKQHFAGVQKSKPLNVRSKRRV